MKIVIDIPEKMYNDIKKSGYIYPELAEELALCIIDSSTLTKKHGRLIDADAFIAKLEDTSKRQQYKKLLIDDCLTVDDVFKAIIKSMQNTGLANGDTPTIIEADKAER